MTVTPFAQLLAAWRAARHPSTSELVEAIGQKVRVALSPLPKKKGDAARAWLAAVKTEPATHLSARLTQLAPFVDSTQASVVWPLFEALSRLEPDPRVATFAARLLLSRRATITAKLTRRLLDCVEVHGDRSHAALLAQEDLRLDDVGIAARAQRLLDRMLETPVTGPALPPEERKRLLALDWKPDAVVAAEDPLEAVYAHPSDRARRQVLADVLLERGDPRGEFISLQLANASPRRQKTLLKAHQARWLGPLADVLDLRDEAPAFVDGFVAEVSVRDVKLNQFLLAADATEWATVTRVRRGLKRLSPSMRALRFTGPITIATVEHWAREKFDLPALEAVWLYGDPGEMAAALERAPHTVAAVTAAIPGYSATRELRNGVAALASVPGLKRLRMGSFTVDVIPRLVREITLEWFPKTLEVIEYGDEERQVRLERAGDGWAVRLFDAEPPHVSAHWKDLLFGVRGLVPRRLEVNFSSAPGIADLADFTNRLSELRVEPSIRYEQPLPRW